MMDSSDISDDLMSQDIQETVTFSLREPMSKTLCDLLKKDIRREVVIADVLKDVPSATPELANDSFDRFAMGLDAGELHLEGNLFGVNEVLYHILNTYLEQDALSDVFPEEWALMDSNEQEMLLDEASRIRIALGCTVFSQEFEQIQKKKAD